MTATSIAPPHTYAEWVAVIDMLKAKTDDEAVRLERIELMEQLVEAIKVICEFKRFYEHFAIRVDDRSEVVELGNIDADIVHG